MGQTRVSSTLRASMPSDRAAIQHEWIAWRCGICDVASASRNVDARGMSPLNPGAFEVEITEPCRLVHPNSRPVHMRRETLTRLMRSRRKLRKRSQRLDDFLSSGKRPADVARIRLAVRGTSKTPRSPRVVQFDRARVNRAARMGPGEVFKRPQYLSQASIHPRLSQSGTVCDVRVERPLREATRASKDKQNASAHRKGKKHEACREERNASVGDSEQGPQSREKHGGADTAR